MISFRIFLFMACVALASSYYEEIGQYVPNTCKWSPCASRFQMGHITCEEYGIGLYTGDTREDGCSFWETQALCCTLIPLEEGCHWTPKNYYTLFSNPYIVCKELFGKNYIPKSKFSTNYFPSYHFHCCPTEVEPC